MQYFSYPFDSELLLKKKRAIKRDLLASGSARIKKKIAILGGSTTDEIKNILELFLLNYDIEAEFYESDYAQYWEDAVFGEKLREFGPDVAFIHTTCRNIMLWPSLRDSREQIDALLAGQMLHFSQMWDKLARDIGCAIIQNNFERPGYRLLGNKDVSDFRGRTNYISRLNQQFYEYAQTHEGFYINDIDYLSSSYGLDKWADATCWHMYKYALNIAAIPELAFSVANIIKSLYGKNKKALVLDLDNTLWGGVIGDDGADGLVLGPESPVGQAYREFQEYIKAHKDLGVILNICSKNDYENAVAGLNHPDSVLSPEDFIVIKANWENKDRNIAQIASELDIGGDSIVFIDDNPAEREIVASQIADVAAPAIGNVEEYIGRIDRAGFFETTIISSDDIKRSEMYRQNAQRAQIRTRFQDYSDYLKSLEMVAVIRDFEPAYMQRIAQLINKTNQFNLTTRRYSENELMALKDDENYIRIYGRLTDKFGDNGLVSVIIGRKDGVDLHIELWLMSCRVLKRDMEYAMFGRLIEKARGIGIEKLVGYYYPTAKNSMVREHYAILGFDKVAEDSSGNTVWEYGVDDSIRESSVIRVIGSSRGSEL